MEILINIDVDDLNKAIEFYEKAFDFRFRRRLFNGEVAEMIGASWSVYLVKKSPGSSPNPGASAVRDYRRHWTPVHLDLVVDDLDSHLEKALIAGAELEATPHTFSWGRLATISDPFGHGFCLIQWVGRGYDDVE